MVQSQGISWHVRSGRLLLSTQGRISKLALNLMRSVIQEKAPLRRLDYRYGIQLP
jgi:hypothetical protein